MNFAFEVPIKAQSTANLREHWAAKYKRVDAQKRAVAVKFPRKELHPLLNVKLVRVSPRELDDDNLRAALKSVRDAVAIRLGVDDRSPLVAWDYGQEKGKPGQHAVRVEVAVEGV